jgi:hypothetical protein
MSPEERFDELVASFDRALDISRPGEGRGFGSNALRVRGKVFAMLVRGRLVVKLPKNRVDLLVRSGDGIRFDANKGTPMKEWFSLDPTSDLEWRSLACEAMAFVSPTQLEGGS